MPNENEQSKKTNPQNPPSDEINDNANGEKSTGSKKVFFNSIFEIFKHFFPALKEGFAAGTKTFKRRIRGITEPKENGAEEERQSDASPSITKTEGEGGEKSLPQQKGFKSKLTAFKQTISTLKPFRKPVTSIPAPAKDTGNEETAKTKTAAGSKQRKFGMAFLIALIIIVPVLAGLYLGGMFDKEGGEKGKSVSAAPQKDLRQENVFDTVFGKKSPKPPATPKEKLAAMRISYTSNNFVKYAGQNDMAVVKLFIQAGMHPDTHRPIDGFTPLMSAIFFDRQKMAEFFLDVYGADINAKDTKGETALIKAVKNNRSFMVEMLLKRKADYNIADNQGNTALSLAKKQYGDNPLTKSFERFGIDISGTQKEPAKDKKPKPAPQKTDSETAPSPSPSPASATAPAAPKPKTTRYQEVSVEEALNFFQSNP